MTIGHVILSPSSVLCRSIALLDYFRVKHNLWCEWAQNPPLLEEIDHVNSDNSLVHGRVILGWLLQKWELNWPVLKQFRKVPHPQKLIKFSCTYNTKIKVLGDHCNLHIWFMCSFNTRISYKFVDRNK